MRISLIRPMAGLDQLSGFPRGMLPKRPLIHSRGVIEKLLATTPLPSLQVWSLYGIHTIASLGDMDILAIKIGDPVAHLRYIEKEC